MSSIYALEPPTRGLLTLRTTHGPISVSLWADESPRATRSFVQHALNGYYTGTPFHRVVPGVLVQAGDPTGTGAGGSAAHGPLRRELHGRLKFRRRGILALVADEEGMCGSQFFLTLAETPWLNGAHTIFGSVVGDSIFALLGLAEAANGAESPPRVVAVEVEDNPFPDVVRDVKEEKVGKKDPLKKDPLKKVAVRDNRKLSFADTADGSGSESDDNEGGKPLPRQRAFAPPQPRAKQTLPTPAAPATDADSAPAPPADKVADKVAVARAEFARLLQHGKKKKKAAKSPSAPAPAAGSTTALPPKPPTGPAARPAAPPLPPTGGVRKRDAIAFPRARRARAGAQEADVLRRLAGFEQRVVAARARAPSGDPAGDANAETPWFARPLAVAKSTTPAGDAEEYEAREGLPDATGAGRRR